MCHVPGAPSGRQGWEPLPSMVAQAPAAPATATPRSLDSQAQPVVPPLSTRALAATPRRRCVAALGRIEQLFFASAPQPRLAPDARAIAPRPLFEALRPHRARPRPDWAKW